MAVRAKDGCPHQPACALARVACERFQPLPAPRFARVFAHDGRIAEEAQRRLARLGLAHAGCAVLCDLLIEMEAQLVIECCAGSVAAEERAEHHSHSIEQTACRPP